MRFYSNESYRVFPKYKTLHEEERKENREMSDSRESIKGSKVNLHGGVRVAGNVKEPVANTYSSSTEALSRKRAQSRYTVFCRRFLG